MAACRRIRPASFYVLAALALIVPVAAQGAGLETPDNGAYVLARGGTAVSLTGTAYSLEFNPAGLTDIESWDIRLDMRLVGNAVTFQRAGNTSDGVTPFAKVSNQAGPFLGPLALIAYHPRNGWLHHFAFGLGVYGPPGIGQYNYASPDAINDPYGANSGQRYSVVSSSALILFPSLGIAFSPVKQLSLGVTLQSAYANIQNVQAIAGKSLGGTENLGTDALTTLKVTDPFRPTLVAGVMVKPVEGVTIGASYRPEITLHANGTFDISTISPNAYLDQVGNQASLTLHMAPEARVGVGWERGRWSAAAEGTYEGWHVNNEIVIDGSKIATYTDPQKQKEGAPPTPVGVQHIAKGWQDSYGGRIGGSYRIIQKTPDNDFGLQVHLGALYETNAIPDSMQGPDQVQGNRAAVSTGVTVAYGDLALTLSGMYYTPVSMTNTTSTVARQVGDSTDPDKQPVYVGRGTYTSSIWIAALGLAWTPHTSF